MIDPIRILKRAWHILWNYRTLWIFGLIVALTASGGGGGGGGSNFRLPSTPGGGNGTPPLGEAERWLQEFFRPLRQMPESELLPKIIGITVILFGIILAVAVVATIARYVSQTAMIRMVNTYEEQGTQVDFREGWRLGWSRSAWRLFLIDLVLAVPVLMLLMLLIPLVVLILAGASTQQAAITLPLIILGVGGIILWVLVLIALGILLGIIGNLAHRASALENLGVFAAIRRSLALIRTHWKSVGVVWLVLLGLSIAWAIITIILFLVLIPLYLFMAIPGILVGGLPGLLIYGVTSLFLPAPLAVITALVIGLPLFFLVTFSPMLLIHGWAQVFLSNVWTLTYRELLALEHINLINDLDKEA